MKRGGVIIVDKLPRRPLFRSEDSDLIVYLPFLEENSLTKILPASIENKKLFFQVESVQVYGLMVSRPFYCDIRVTKKAPRERMF